MSLRELPEKFLVAFSLAGEQRELVHAVAQAVEAKLGLGTVFYDEWFEHFLAGNDADLKLQKLYGERCELAVVCVSKAYGGKPWTKAELAAIRARQMRLQGSEVEGDEFRMLPLRFGDGDVEGILFNTIAPDVRARPPAMTAELIVNRLRLIVPVAVAQPEHRPTDRRIYLAESTPDMDDPRTRIQAFLEDLGWQVLPDELYPEDQYRARLESDLRQCRAYVQLLGPYPFKRGGFDRIQSEAAAALAMVRFRYRSSDLDLAKVEGSHREFLLAPDVISAGLEDFKVLLRKKLTVLADQSDLPPATDIPPRVFVALRCENPDSVWEQVFQWIYEQEQMDHYELRPDESLIARFQAEPCHGFLVVCDATALSDGERSPRDLMDQCRQIQLKEKDARHRPPVALVYWPPPSPSWARLLRCTPLNLYRIRADEPTNLADFFSAVRRIAE